MVIFELLFIDRCWFLIWEFFVNVKKLFFFLLYCRRWLEVKIFFGLDELIFLGSFKLVIWLVVFCILIIVFGVVLVFCLKFLLLWMLIVLFNIDLFLKGLFFCLMFVIFLLLVFEVLFEVFIEMFEKRCFDGLIIICINFFFG